CGHLRRDRDGARAAAGVGAGRVHSSRGARTLRLLGGSLTAYPFFFTWTEQRRATPVQLAGGRGAHFETTDGSRWLDLASFSYQANLGHGHPRMVAAIQRQAEELCVTMPNA